MQSCEHPLLSVEDYDLGEEFKSGASFSTTPAGGGETSNDTSRTFEKQPMTAVLKPDVAFHAQPTPPRSDCSSSAEGTKSPGLPLPGQPPPPSFVSQLFYETVRNSKPPLSCPTPSSTGATRGENSSSDIHDDTPPLTPMSAPRDGYARRADEPRSPPPDHSDAASGSHRPARLQASSAQHQRSLQRQSFNSTTPTYYPSHATPAAEQAYGTSGGYAQHSALGPNFMGQYMSSQPPPHSMAMQSPMTYAYSQPYAHPGIHAQDPSGMGMPFTALPPPQINRGYNYQAGPSSPAPSSPFGTSPGPTQPSTSGQPTSSQHVSHHTFAPIHFPPGPSTGHYAYPTPSFAHSSPGLYPYVPGPYPQSFYGQSPSSPEDATKGGTWWYLPPGSQQYDPPPYPGAYSVQGYQPSIQMNRSEFDPYSQPSPPTNAYAAPPGQQQQQPHSMMRLHPRETIFPPSLSAPDAVPPTGAPVAVAVPAREAASPPPSSQKRSPFDTASDSPPAGSRKAYHPNPPPNRSEWVMWVGNVPSDATHDELWRFFNQPAPAHPPPPGTSAVMSSRQVQVQPHAHADDVWCGVASVFLISRSNCAFVNFETEHHLECAVNHFNGKPLRAKDARCPRLVCRVRRRDDDLKAGVGGQRGMGLHIRWVTEQKEREQDRERERESKRQRGEGEGDVSEEEQHIIDGTPTSPSTYLAPSSSSDPSPPIPALSPLDDPSPVPLYPVRESPEDRELPRHGSSGDRSFASTNSSFLATNFPKRYFILKSLTQHDLNLSLERGLWATQQHNEGILDQAYRTSTDVFLIFGANKSGEFFGYARMAGPVYHNERVDHVPWTSRPTAPPSSGHRGSSPPEVIHEEDESDRSFLSPGENRLVNESPAAITPGQETRLKLAVSPSTGPPSKRLASAPEQPHRALTRPTLPREAETYPEPKTYQKAIELLRHPKAISEGPPFPLHLPPAQESAAKKANMSNPVAQPLPNTKGSDGVVRLDTYRGESEVRHLCGESATSLSPRAGSTLDEGRPQNEEDKPEDWGREFKIEWLRTERLPFHRTRHLRNPWNHDREVKVSRDGTEIEPTVGQQLLDEWDKLSEPSSPILAAARGRNSKLPAKSPSVAAPAFVSSITSQLFHTSIGAGGGSSGSGRGRGTS
ncbi:hypothetical protein K439DRAFT_1406014 [Ramaria rubella]|nr:hypothetical protein K439DRAFT_1406014 [Ramaria rubella]